jgi:hypothetical protein
MIRCALSLGSGKTQDDVTEATDASRLQRLFLSWMTDILLNIVVLGLFVEYFDSFTIDSFTIVIFTAFVLKALLSITLAIEHRVRNFFWQRDGLAYRAAGFLAAWVILFGSKFAILEVINFIFRDHVEIDGFVSLILLVITMILAEWTVEAIYKRLALIQTGDSE